ncbi:MAG: hypothetical protein ACI87A_001934 [Planctomycetota bacterium]|jgi:hypothetical protein
MLKLVGVRKRSTRCDNSTELFIAHGLPVEVPSAIHGVDDVEVDVVLGLLAAREFADDLNGVLTEALLNFAAGECEGRNFPLDPGTFEGNATGVAVALFNDLDIRGDVGRHDRVAGQLVPLEHRVREALDGKVKGVGREDVFSECQCKRHDFRSFVLCASLSGAVLVFAWVVAVFPCPGVLK